MELYKNKQIFYDVVTAAASFFKINPTIIEKDYYVTILLQKNKDSIPGVLFKGGTSLSKCFKAIDRFSKI